MKIISVTLVLVLCVLLTAALEQKSNEVTSKDNDRGEDTEDSGSTTEVETDEGSAESGDEEDESQPEVPVPKPMKFRYLGFRGPVKITPMEPNINRQKPFRRKCFFCFPRGRLGRVEVTAPGGPYLMNGFGPLNGFGGIGYPDMGFPEAGPDYPSMGMGYPAMGPGEFGNAGLCCSGPCCGSPCCGGDSNQGPMMFEGISEEEAPKGHASNVHDKTVKEPPSKEMQQLPNKALPQPPNKARDQPPNKAMDQPPNKAMDQPPNKAMDQPPNKAMDQPPNKAMEQPPNKAMDQPSNKILEQAPNKESQQASNKVAMDQPMPMKKLNDKPNKPKSAAEE